MRLSVALLALAVLLVAGFASAGRIADIPIPEEMKANPPAGTYWSEELGVFVFDPPVPIMEPEPSMLASYSMMLYYDNSLLYYTLPQFDDYFAATRFTTPEIEGGFMITAVAVACFNDEGFDPEEGKIAIYTHSTAPECRAYTLEGDKIGNEWTDFPFVGNPYSQVPDPTNPPMVSWTIVEINPPVIIDPAVDPEFWVAMDYRPGIYEPGGFYTVAGYNGNMGPLDWQRFCEAWGSGCPGPLPEGYGAWGIRVYGDYALGEIEGGMVDIKPTSCPNPIKYGDIGDVAVALVGSDDFDVTQVYDPGMDGDLWKVLWMTVPGHEGRIYPYKETGIKDVVTPYYDPVLDCYDCTTLGADGKLDWPFHFETAAVWDFLTARYGELEDRTCKLVEFHWEMDFGGDGEPDAMMSDTDMFWIQLPRQDGELPPGQEIGATRVGDARGFALYQNAPNPFRGETTVRFSIPSNSHTTLTVHDVSGRTIATLVDGELSAGTHAVEWDATAPSGVYFCRLVAGGETAGTRMVVAR